MTDSLRTDYTLRPTDRLAPVVPIVHYTGASPWNAAPRVIDLVSRDASGAGRGEAGAGTAERLAGLLAKIGDSHRLAEVGDWIIDCTTGDDLIARFGNGAKPSS